MASEQYPPVVVVDENDNEIGAAPLADVWAQGLHHRIVSVVVLDDQGRMLLQLRGPNVRVYPNCWDQAVGGHVDEGFSYDQAAKNEVAEEIGIHDVELAEVGKFRTHNQERDRIINQFEKVYVARVPHDIQLRSQAEEVDTLQWFTPKELKMRVAEHAAQFTPGLVLILKTYFPSFI